MKGNLFVYFNFGLPSNLDGEEWVAHNEVSLDSNGHDGVDRAGQGDLSQRVDLGEDDGVHPRVPVLAHDGHREQKEADEDVHRVVHRQQHHQPVKLELILQPENNSFKKLGTYTKTTIILVVGEKRAAEQNITRT